MKIKFLIITIFLIVSCKAQNWTIYNTSNSPIPHNRTHKTIKDNDGNYWFATNGGLAKFDGASWETFTPSNSNIEESSVIDLIYKDNVFWLAYSYGGIGRFDGSNFIHFDLDDLLNTPWEGTNNVQGIDIDINNNIWIATYNGLVKYDGTDFSRIHNGNGLIGPNNRCWAVKCDPSSDIVWVGTFDAGLLKYNGNNFTQYFIYDPNTPPFSNYQQVNRIIFDTEGDIWCTGYGVVEFDKNTMLKKSQFTSNNGLGDPLVWGISFDFNSTLWVGSDCLNGIFYYKNGVWGTYNETNSGFPQDICYYVYDIFVDENNTKWMAHGSQGIVVYNENGISSSIQENEESNINVFPNPFENETTFDIGLELKNADIFIYDISGNLVKKQDNINGKKYKIDCSSLNSGFYTVNIFNKKKSYSSKIIIE